MLTYHLPPPRAPRLRVLHVVAFAAILLAMAVTG